MRQAHGAPAENTFRAYNQNTEDWALHILSEFPTGKHHFGFDHTFVNIVEYKTSAAFSQKWEAHREYLDIHLMLSGQEYIEISPIETMNVEPYQQSRDFVPMTGSAACRVLLTPGDFIICYPSDGHRSGIMTYFPASVKRQFLKLGYTTDRDHFAPAPICPIIFALVLMPRRYLNYGRPSFASVFKTFSLYNVKTLSFFAVIFSFCMAKALENKHLWLRLHSMQEGGCSACAARGQYPRAA